MAMALSGLRHGYSPGQIGVPGACTCFPSSMQLPSSSPLRPRIPGDVLLVTPHIIGTVPLLRTQVLHASESFTLLFRPVTFLMDSYSIVNTKTVESPIASPIISRMRKAKSSATRIGSLLHPEHGLSPNTTAVQSEAFSEFSTSGKFLVSKRNSFTLEPTLASPEPVAMLDSEQSPSVPSDTPLLQFQTLRFSDLKLSLKSNRKRRLKYFTRLAGQLAGEGRLNEFAEFLQMLADAGINTTIFTLAIDLDQVDAGLSLLLAQGQLDFFVTILQKLNTAGYAARRFVGRGAFALLSDEFRKLLAAEKAQYCVQVLHSLADCGFLVKKLAEPSLVVAGCVRTRSIDLVHSYVRLLSHNVRHYNLVIREFGYLGELASAFSVFDLMKEEGASPDTFTYRALIDSCGQSGEPSKASVVFEGMIKGGILPNVYIYNSIINANIGNMEEVHRLYHHMQGAGVAGDTTTFNILLKACGASGHTDLAVNFYHDLQLRGDLTMDVITYSTLINVFGEAKMWEEALKVKADMLAAGVIPNVVTWTSVIGACANAGQVEQAFRSFDEMLGAGCSPNVNCYSVLIHACVKGGQYDRAFGLFQEWKRSGRIQSFGAVDSKGLAYGWPSGEVEDGEANSKSEINHQTASKADVVAFSNIERNETGLNGTDRIYKTKEVFTQKVGARSSLCTPNVVTYNILMKACGAVPQSARALMAEMVSWGFEPDLKSWSILMDAYSGTGDLPGCLNVLEEVKEAGLTPDVILYTTIIKACVQAGSADKAFSFFEQMKVAGVRPNVVTYNTLLRAQRTCGQFHEVQRALAIYDEMRDAGYAPNDFLLHGLLKEWAEGVIEDHGGRAHIRRGLEYEERGNPEYTELLLQKVAVHARSQSNMNNLIIDLHGLSKGEARTAVLAVLRIIKERCSNDDGIQDDLVIITGVGHRSEVHGVPVIRDAVLQVLQTELGLPAVCLGNEVPSTPDESPNHSSRASSVQPDLGGFNFNPLATFLRSRKPSQYYQRPAMLGLVKERDITKLFRMDMMDHLVTNHRRPQVTRI